MKPFVQTVDVAKMVYLDARKVTRVVQLFILEVVLRFLHGAGFTHQTLKVQAIQQNEELRLYYCTDVLLYHKDMLVFIDEPKKKLIISLERKVTAYIRGKPAVTYKLLVRKKHISVIAAISIRVLLDLEICRGGDSDIFHNFTTQRLLVHLNPFTDDNPQSEVILDNCTIHHTNE